MRQGRSVYYGMLIVEPDTCKCILIFPTWCLQLSKRWLLCGCKNAHQNAGHSVHFHPSPFTRPSFLIFQGSSTTLFPRSPIIVKPFSLHGRAQKSTIRAVRIFSPASGNPWTSKCSRLKDTSASICQRYPRSQAPPNFPSLAVQFLVHAWGDPWNKGMSKVLWYKPQGNLSGWYENGSTCGMHQANVKITACNQQQWWHGSDLRLNSVKQDAGAFSSATLNIQMALKLIIT